MEHPDEPSVDHERHAEQRPEPPLQQDRAVDDRPVDVVEHDRPPARGDLAGEARADAHPHPPAHLGLEADRGGGDQVARALVEQQDDRGLDVEELPHPLEDLGEQRLDGHLAQGGVGERLDAAQALGLAGSAGLLGDGHRPQARGAA